MAVKGMDVSAFQGIIDWDKIKKTGDIKYAILRAGWGQGTLDKYFKRNADECTRLGIPFGIYWFSYATNPTYAQKEAQFAMKAASGYKLAYPIWFDFEYDSISYAAKCGVYIDKNAASAIAKSFMETVKAAGLQTGNYSNLDFCNRYFNTEINTKYDLWYAYWGAANSKTNSAAMWQYTSKGAVAGIVGNVDMDYSNKKYPASTPSGGGGSVTPDAGGHKIPAIYNLVFDAAWYYKTYPDLKSTLDQLVANGSVANTDTEKAWWLYQHFLMFGMEEASNGRRGNTDFDVVKYKAAYADLRAAFGDTSWKPYYYHYMSTGYNEIQTGKRANYK